MTAPPEPAALPLVPMADGLRLRVHVTPRAATARLGPISDDGSGPRLRVHVTAAPHDGEANAAVIRLLAKTWRLPRTALSVVAGAGGRDKTIAIRGDAGALQARLAVHLAAPSRTRP